MNEDIYKRIEEIFSKGKITEQEKERLIKAFLQGEKKLDGINEIEIHLKTADIELEGVNDLYDLIFEEGYLNITKENQKLILKSSFSENRKVKVLIPFKTNIRLKSISSDVKISNVLGHVEVQSVSSDIELNNISESVLISVISGDIKASNIFGKADINTKSGDILVKNSKLNAFLKTYSGDISCIDSEFDSSRFTSFKGNMTYENCLFKNENLVKTYFGDIKIKNCPNSFSILGSTVLGEVKGKLQRNSNGKDVLKVETKFGDILKDD